MKNLTEEILSSESSYLNCEIFKLSMYLLALVYAIPRPTKIDKGLIKTNDNTKRANLLSY